MGRIVCVHGIGQEYESRESLLKDWGPWLAGGVSNAEGTLDVADVDMAFYGLLYRPKGKKGAESIPEFAAGDLSPLEQEMLKEIHDASVVGSSETKGATRTIAGMLQAVGQTPFFGQAAQRIVIWYLKQVSQYVDDPSTNAAVRWAVRQAIGDDTRVLVAHSLGSIVSWEVLCAHPELPVRTFVTIGSPLGLSALRSRLDPSIESIPGQWPAGIERWVNIADARDVVALEKKLARVFGPKVKDYVVENGATMHNVKPYLTSPELGRAIIAGLG